MAKGEDLRTAGRAVAARRGELDMTQQDLADAAGVDLKTVYNLESGARWPIARNRAAISRALGWSGDGLARLVAAPSLERLPLGAEEFARAHGVDPGNPLDPFVRAVNDEIDRAEEIYGEDVTGIQAFHGGPAAEIEAMVFDAPGVSREAKVVAIATLRASRESARPARRNAGLIPLLTLAGR